MKHGITQIFYKIQSTSKARTADPISIGATAILDEGKACTFYAEFTDFDRRKCDEWVLANIVSKLKYNFMPCSNLKITPCGNGLRSIELLADSKSISTELKTWLAQFGEVEFWADYDVIDKPMLIDLIAEFDEKCEAKIIDISTDVRKVVGEERYKIGLPTHLPNVPYYAFYDLHTLLREQGLDPDMSRQGFIAEKGRAIAGEPHHALYDAWVCAYTYLMLAERQEAKSNLAILEDRLETLKAAEQMGSISLSERIHDLEALIREARYICEKYTV